MKPVHPLIRIFTATSFVLLMGGFIALKSGAFDRLPPHQLPPLAAKKLIQHKFQRPDPVQTKNHAGPYIPTEIDYMISSSKTTIVASPWNFSRSVAAVSQNGNPVGLFAHKGVNVTMMSGSKSSLVFEQPYAGSVFKGILAGIPLMKVDRPVLKQGKRK